MSQVAGNGPSTARQERRVDAACARAVRSASSWRVDAPFAPREDSK